MEFNEHHEDQEEETGNYQTLVNSAGGEGEAISARKGGGGSIPPTSYRYKECLKNHAVSIGGHAVDGCGEFIAAGEEGSLESLKCAACNCHRNFHRKESQGFHHQFLPPYSFRAPHPSGYLHVTPPPPPTHHPRPLALPSSSREDEDDVSNPSSSGGGGGGGGGGSRAAGGSKKRYRTRFSQEQKEKMLGFAERVGWRIQKEDEGLVQQFCGETNVKRHVLKVWMHNNKHTLAKKP